MSIYFSTNDGEVFEYDHNELKHFGIKGMKWGVRRFQNEDGSLTPAGQQRYNKLEKRYKKAAKKYEKNIRKGQSYQVLKKAAIDSYNKSFKRGRKAYAGLVTAMANADTGIYNLKAVPSGLSATRNLRKMQALTNSNKKLTKQEKIDSILKDALANDSNLSAKDRELIKRMYNKDY